MHKLLGFSRLEKAVHTWTLALNMLNLSHCSAAPRLKIANIPPSRIFKVELSSSPYTETNAEIKIIDFIAKQFPEKHLIV